VTERNQFTAAARQLIQFDRSQLAFGAALRLLPAMVIVLAAALILDAPGAGAVAAASTYVVGIGSFQQFTRSRAGPMLFAWAGAVLSTFIGTLAGGSTVGMALAALVYGFWCGLLPAIGMGAFWVGQQCIVFLLVAGAYAGGLGAALGRTSLVLVGGAVQIACFAAMLFLAEGRARVPSPVGLIDDFRVAMLRLEFPVRQRSALFGFALRFAFTLVAAVATERLLAIPNGYWVAMTALLLMRPDFQDTLARGLGRVGGTIAGAAAAGALSHFYEPGPVRARGAGRALRVPRLRHPAPQFRRVRVLRHELRDLSPGAGRRRRAARRRGADPGDVARRRVRAAGASRFLSRAPAPPASGDVVGTCRGEDVEVKRRLVADQHGVVHGVRRHHREPAGSQPHDFIADIKIDHALEDIDDLFMGMGMRCQRVPRQQAMQRDGRALAGEGLALDAWPDGAPRDLFPIDLMDQHPMLHWNVTVRPSTTLRSAQDEALSLMPSSIFLTLSGAQRSRMGAPLPMQRSEPPIARGRK
jgi:hypothetical protein